MAESADALPFSVANILKVDLPKGVTKQGQPSCNADKALTLAERLADVIMDAKNNAEGGAQKRRRTRTAFTQYQLTTLENAFSHTHYPDVVMREQLMIWTRLPDSTIQIWFKNRRAKFRKERRTCILNVNKDFSVEESNSVLPVNPVCCQVGVPPWLPILAPHNIKPSTTRQIQGDTKLIPLQSISSLSSPASPWELA